MRKSFKIVAGVAGAVVLAGVGYAAYVMLSKGDEIAPTNLDELAEASSEYEVVAETTTEEPAAA